MSLHDAGAPASSPSGSARARTLVFRRPIRAMALRPIVTAFALTIALAGCAGSGSTASPASATSAPATPTASPNPTPTPALTAAESALPVVSGSALPTEAPIGSFSAPVPLYLRMWYINPSIGPENYFGNSTVISDGELYYMPEIQATTPVPMYHSPRVATISQSGLATILAAAQRDGLLGTTQEFTCPHSEDAGMIAGTGTNYVTISLSGVTHDLSGNCMWGGEEPTPTPASLEPGTYDAYMDFVAHMQNLSGWIGSDIGTSSEWAPTSLAVTAAVPGDSDWWSPAVEPGNTAKWLVGTFANFGSASDPANLRCGVLTGSDLTKQLPSIKLATEGTVFIDSTGAQRVLAVRVVMPGEPTAGFCS